MNPHWLRSVAKTHFLVDDFRLTWSRKFTDTLKWRGSTNVPCYWRKRCRQKLNPNYWCNHTFISHGSIRDIAERTCDFTSETPLLFAERQPLFTFLLLHVRVCIQWVPGLFPGGKAAAHPHPAPRLTKEYSLSGPSWPVLGWNLHACVAPRTLSVEINVV